MIFHLHTYTKNHNMKMVLDSIDGLGTKPVFTPTIYFNNDTINISKIDSINTAMFDFCKERDFEFMDIREVLCNTQEKRDRFYQEDNTHLKQEAYEPWVAKIKAILAKHKI